MEIKRNTIPGTPRTERAFGVGDQIRGTLSGRTLVVLEVGKRHNGEPEYRCIQTNGIDGNKGKLSYEFGDRLKLVNPGPEDYIEATPDKVTYTIEASEEELTLLRGGVGNMCHRDAVRVLGAAYRPGSDPLIPLYNTLRKAGI